jgi:hypothetical protein
MKTARPLSFHARQRGAIMVFVVLAMVAMLGLSGLALDGAHAMLSKSRLQNAVDSAALSAAKTLAETGNLAAAMDEARFMFAQNAGSAGSGEIDAAFGDGSLTLSIQFSNELDPFVPVGNMPAQYVRVRATNLRLRGWLIPVMGVNEKIVGATAVAGPSASLDEVCNVVPMMACGVAPSAGVSDPFFGYQDRTLTILKASAQGGEVGPGNFHLVRLDGSQGGSDIRDAMAGDFDACVNVSEEVIETEPGNTAGPVRQGLNTRFGIGSDTDHPPDIIVTEVEPRLTFHAQSGEIRQGGQAVDPANPPAGMFDYDAYEALRLSPSFTPYPGGKSGRRTLAMPIGDCAAGTQGQGQVPLLGVLCFHLLQSVGSGQEPVFGQFVGEGCLQHGNPGPVPNAGPGPYIIQLYKDPNATDA